MKILQINASYKPAYVYGGPTMSVSKLSEQMAGAGNKVNVFTTTANGETELPVAPNNTVNIDDVDVIYFKRLTKDHSHFSPALLIRLWKDVKNFDVVHIHAWWNLVSVLSCLLAVLRRVPVVVSPRGTLSLYSFGNKNTVTKKLIHYLLGRPLLKRSYIHVTSPREKQGLIGLINPKAFIDIPNFIALPAYSTDTDKIPNEVLKLLFFSRIEEKKGLDILFNALPNVNIPYTLTIAGDGDSAYIKSLKLLAENNKITGYINWIGFQQDNKFNVLQQHDLMVLPSYDENFGNVVIESLSMGTAVLISKQVGLARYVEENNFGWISEQNADSFSKYLNLVYKQRDKLTVIRQNAPTKVRDDFNEAKLTKSYTDMYNQIIQHD